MKIIFECEICGYRSENKEEIQRCEAQGNKHNFSKGQKVEFLLAPRGLRRLIRAKVESIEFEKKTHKVFYELLCSSEVISSLGGLGDDPLIMKIAEEQIRCLIL